MELFYTARRVPSIPATVSTNLSVPSNFSGSQDSTPPPVPLANVVLDTLLCILVDSPPAMRVFEDANGVQILIKMFKRSGTSREVRSVATTVSISVLYWLNSVIQDEMYRILVFLSDG